MPTTKKAIYFDLDYNALKYFYSNTSPNNAYAEIEKYMLDNGFEHRQRSGYVSLKAMRLNEITDFVKQMSREFPWLHKCYKKFDVANIGVVHNLDIYLDEPYYEIDVDLEISNENIVDHNEDYKLVEIEDDLYELRNLDDEIISTSTFNNIEDALDEIDERNIGIEL